MNRIAKIAALLVALTVVSFASIEEIEERFYYIGSDGEESNLELRGDVYYDQNKPYNGKIMSQYDGATIYHGNMKEGKLNGEKKSFYESGKLQSVSNYKDGYELQ